MPAAPPAVVAERLPEVLHAGFNQDGSCFTLGTDAGFLIFCTESRQLLHKEDCGASRLVEMLFRTSLVALSGVGSEAAKLTMWNTKERSNICQLSFGSEVCAVRMNPRRIIVLLRQKVHVFDLLTMRSLHVFDRSSSPRVDPALCWLCPDPERGYLATPVEDAAAAIALPSMLQGGGGGGAGVATVLDTHTLRTVGVVVAHKSPLQALCLNPTGELMASASTKGTVVRVFTVPALDLIHELRRGTSPCRIFGLNFSCDSAFICASAASGTVHVFRNPGFCQWTGPLRPALPPASPRGERLAEEKFAEGSELDALAADIDSMCDFGAEELSDWNVVADRSQWCPEDCSSYKGISMGEDKSMLKVLAKQASRHLVSSLMEQVVQPCRELVDVPGAVALVHLSGRGAEADSCPTVCTRSLVAGLQSVLRGTPKAVHAHTGYVAYVSTRRLAAGGNERPEVLVVTKTGCALSYEVGASAGSECRLLKELLLFQTQQPPQQQQLLGRGKSGIVVGADVLASPRALEFGPLDGTGEEQQANCDSLDQSPAVRGKRHRHTLSRGKARASAEA